jgi:hypothetical protein
MVRKWSTVPISSSYTTPSSPSGTRVSPFAPPSSPTCVLHGAAPAALVSTKQEG